MLIGRVARLLSGASIDPRMLAVATITVLLPPASACPIASTSALRLARRSPLRVSKGVSAIADITFSGRGISQNGAAVLACQVERRYCAARRSRLSEMTVGRLEKGQSLAFGIEKSRRRIPRNDPADRGHRNASR